jgi:hypothetical protein
MKPLRKKTMNTMQNLSLLTAVTNLVEHIQHYESNTFSANEIGFGRMIAEEIAAWLIGEYFFSQDGMPGISIDGAVIGAAFNAVIESQDGREALLVDRALSAGFDFEPHQTVKGRCLAVLEEAVKQLENTQSERMMNTITDLISAFGDQSSYQIRNELMELVDVTEQNVDRLMDKAIESMIENDGFFKYSVFENGIEVVYHAFKGEIFEK